MAGACSSVGLLPHAIAERAERAGVATGGMPPVTLFVLQVLTRRFWCGGAQTR